MFVLDMGGMHVTEGEQLCDTYIKIVLLCYYTAKLQ